MLQIMHAILTVVINTDVCYHWRQTGRLRRGRRVTTAVPGHGRRFRHIETSQARRDRILRHEDPTFPPFEQFPANVKFEHKHGLVLLTGRFGARDQTWAARSRLS